ncbi:hypothetical protein [Flavobacterium tibetense]|uniref:Uncharacterized protein n=1 Tax=Flavobacterium tibetense TaxID=2233533 RepID=A0A365P2U4_9FLAO|nr:hypothetical protein [Flavobacterium tibetense]RBA28664.1 hypothetical protein DPN68_06535 [Flavobacterium tibetense]
MRIQKTILILTLFLIFSCISKSKENNVENILKESSSESKEKSRIGSIKNNYFLEISIDTLWNNLIFKKGGCLTGGQYVYNDKFGSEGCVMSNSEDWEIFFNKDIKIISNFLINKISDDTTKTNIHTCPFFTAMEGEIAVYGLQRLLKINWYDFNEFNEFQNRQSESSTENHQAWLQNILKNKKKREILINCWKKKASD